MYFSLRKWKTSAQPNAIPPLESIDLVFNYTITANARMLNVCSTQRITQMESSITNLQATQVQNRSGSPPSGIYNTKEHNHISLHGSADQELNGKWAIPSVEESESCDVEKNQLPEPGHIKITGNQSVVAALLNKM